MSYNPTLTKKQIVEIVKYNSKHFIEKYFDGDFIIDEKQNQINQIRDKALDYISVNLPDEITLDELNEMELNDKIFNEDYFIIGYNKADKFIGHNFHAMLQYMEDYGIDERVPDETIRSCEKFANLFAYCVGLNILCSPYDELRGVHNIR